ncbi:MAG: 5-formyltetrahydrofolate cyclo-ligase [Oscillospiraceae bacterium]|nr:5-formyltetrahydrofolate cyclo-ligase [Oscillospiraceae bacterium]MDE6840867.1 5-formyltetrahydrofolate cyclo-ligase [Oscillospiraceae bacterium]
MTVKERKAELRRHAAALPQVEAGALFDRFLALPQVEQADTVMVFYGTGREPDTLPLIRALLERGKRVALPVVLPHRGMEARQVLDPDQLIPNRFGIPEPDGACPAIPKGDISVALIPHLMCDREGYRLGWGGGYYDRWLADFPGFTVCVCRPGRLAERIPREDFDVPVKLVLIEE